MKDELQEFMEMSVPELQESFLEMEDSAISELKQHGMTSHSMAVVEFYFNFGRELIELGRESGDRELARGLFAAADVIAYFTLEMVERTAYSVLLEQIENVDSREPSQISPFLHPDSVMGRVENASLEEELEDVGKQRSVARKELPADNPDCNHSIPIHYLEAAEILLEAAETFGSKNRKTAIGLAEAARYTVGNVERTYEERGFLSYYRHMRG